jgi:hypothetical protein
MVKSKKFITLCKKYGVNPDKVNEVMSFEQACEITGDDPTQEVQTTEEPGRACG